MYTVKTLNKISPTGLNVLDPEKYTVDDNAPNPDAILVRSAKMHDMQFNPELLCIARAGAGTNNIPSDRCADEGIVVFNTPGANSEAVKELAVCALLLASRDVVGGIEWVKSIADKGDEVAAMVEKGKSAFVGPEIKGKSLGVIGLGAVGAKLAAAAANLGMKVYGYDPYISVDAAWHLSSAVIHATDLDTIFKTCDFISIHVPYMESTHHLLNGDAFAKMKDGVRILNLARAELVDDEAILAAIGSGRVACYVTDFPNGAVAGKDHVIAIPHLGASTPESEDNCAFMAAREIREYVENGNIMNSVNMPAAVLPRTGDCRVCVIHENVPDMIAKITSAVSSKKLNIENMVNAGTKNRKYAYTIIDITGSADGLAEEIKAIDGIIRARVL
ncbi:MAG: 3-phosphoglycerate dehydrogenase [Oscillospiraceae bacterium]|nr:3-phosphoglycerate dehydrogenase [Oscillospiraceae bacterium]